MKTLLFKTPFSPSYWRTAASELKDIKKLTICAILIGLQIAMSGLFIPVSDNLRIYATFFIVCLNSCIGGPLMALISGFIADNLSFLLFPFGAYFFGYTLSSMMGALFYALFLYRAKLSVTRIVLAKFCVNFFVNVLMGSVWSTMLYSKGFWFYLTASFIKNVTLFPLEVLLLVFVFKALIPILSKRKLIFVDKLTWI